MKKIKKFLATTSMHAKMLTQIRKDLLKEDKTRGRWWFSLKMSSSWMTSKNRARKVRPLRGGERRSRK